MAWGETKSRDSSVGLGDRMIVVRFLAEAVKFSFRHRVQTGSESHPASYPKDTGVLSLRVKRPGRETDNSSQSSADVKECVELYLHSPNKSSWRDA
jgi:hypothetical protein